MFIFNDPKPVNSGKFPPLKLVLILVVKFTDL